MTEIDTSRGAVKRWAVVRNDSGLGYSDGIAPDKHGGFVDYEEYRALLSRAEKAERERDEAWNAAIEAAAHEAMRENERRLALASIRVPAMACEIRDAIRALKRGSTND